VLGRVIEGSGKPIDGKPIFRAKAHWPLNGEPPLPLERVPIREPMSCGIRAIDGMLTCGRGQRLGIFGGSGVGKSTLIGMMTRSTAADLTVLALVGERGREVREFLDEAIGTEGLALVAMLIHMAGFFVLLNAEFIAMVQVIVYAGAILVLYLFVIMLLNLKSDERVFHKRYLGFGVITIAIVAQVAVLVFRSPYAGMTGEATTEAVLGVGQTKAIGIVMFRDYLLPFELIGIYLLAAIVGAIVLAKTPPASERRAQAEGATPSRGSGNGDGASGPAPEPEPVESVGAHAGGGH
jgi:NADH:ubiquinone oxidoreductase subunit 6 (subunit J)